MIKKQYKKLVFDANLTSTEDYTKQRIMVESLLNDGYHLVSVTAVSKQRTGDWFDYYEHYHFVKTMELI